MAAKDSEHRQACRQKRLRPTSQYPLCRSRNYLLRSVPVAHEIVRSRFAALEPNPWFCMMSNAAKRGRSSTRCRLGHPGATSTVKSSHPNGAGLAAGLLALPPCVRSIAVVRLSGGLRRWAASVVETRPRREPRRRQVQRASLRPQEGQRDKRSERRQPELDVRHLASGDDGYERL